MSVKINDTNDMKYTANTENRLLLPKYDIAFKSIFKDKNNTDVVEDFLKSVLGLPDDEVFDEIIVSDPELLPENDKTKRSVLDVLLNIRGKGIVNVEMQLCKISAMKKRLLHYYSKLASCQLKSGAGYEDFRKVVMIVIADFNFIDDPDNYYHRFVLYDKEHDLQFTDLIEFDIVEAKKVPAVSDNTARWSWAKFFGSSNDEELRAAAKEREKIGKAMLTIEKMSAEDSAWWRTMHEEMARMDEISRMNDARREGIEEGLEKGAIEIASRMKRNGKSVDEIANDTGMTADEIAEIFNYSKKA
jgi:predicted transposase/invertase (TIGR01784 family)